MNYRRKIYIAIILIALGISFNTTLKDSVGSIGTVMIAIGGLFFIAGMAAKKKEEQSDTN